MLILYQVSASPVKYRLSDGNGLANCDRNSLLTQRFVPLFEVVPAIRQLLERLDLASPIHTRAHRDKSHCESPRRSSPLSTAIPACHPLLQ